MPQQKATLFLEDGAADSREMRRDFTKAVTLRKLTGQMACIAAAGFAFGNGPAFGETALQAIKEIPKDQVSRIARIEGQGGTPEPDRWYILTQDGTAENGVHEYVVANGAVVASRGISQFADSLKPEDMLGDAPLKLDSDKAAKLAQDYADANGAVVTSMNYELKKDGTDAAPAWTVSCLDDKGNKVGAVVVTAGKGDVVSHEGFPQKPQAEAEPRATPHSRETPHFDTYAEPQVAAAAVTGTNGSGEGTEEGTPGHRHHHRLVKKPESGIAKTFDNVGRTLKKYLPF